LATEAGRVGSETLPKEATWHEEKGKEGLHQQEMGSANARRFGESPEERMRDLKPGELIGRALAATWDDVS
jgi:hypothetical protein